MADPTSTSHRTSDVTSINTKCKRKNRGATMYTKVKKVHESDVRYSVTVDVAIDRAYGEYAKDFMGYVVLQGRSKVSSLIDSWHDVD